MNRKSLLSFTFIVFLFNFCCGQAWYPLGTGIIGDYGVSAEAVYNGELYVGGWFYQAGNVTANNIARWNGLTWDSVGSGLTGGENTVEAMCVYNGKLYVGGAFFAAEGLSATNIAVWDGSHWDTVSSNGLTYCGSGAGWVDAMAVYKGKLYVAGAFCKAGGVKAENIACWDGTKWDSVSSGINDSVYSLTVYNGNLYAGGQFTRAGTSSVNSIAYWDGTAWHGVGVQGTNLPVLAMQVYKDTLYIGGAFSSAGANSVNSIATWNGTTWGTPGIGILGTVESFCVYNGLLYIGGLFNESGSIRTNNISTWNGTVWDTVGTKGINSTVDALVVMDSSVYAGGEFTIAGNVNASDMAVWGGISLGVNNIDNKAGDIIAYPNPSNGIFTIGMKNNDGSVKNIQVYNMIGEKVYDKMLNPVQYNFTINIAAQPAGIYLYRILDESGNFVGEGKVVIE